MTKREFDVRYFIFLVIPFFFYGIFTIWGTGSIADEFFHTEQVKKILNYDFTQHPGLTTIAGYHFIIAFTSKVFSVSGLNSFRLISAIFNVGILLCVYTFSIKNNNDYQTVIFKTFSVLFLPILWPMLFVVYTDAMALLFVLLYFLFLLDKKYYIAAIIGFLSFLIRQTNIVWVAYGALFVFIEHFNASFVFENIKNYLKKIWSIIVVGVLFIVFVKVNGGVAMGDITMHPPFSLSLGNIEFFLFLFFFLFLPINIYNAKRIYHLMKKHPWLLIVTISLFLIFYLNMNFDHPYNNNLNWWLRNKILTFTKVNIIFKVFFVFCCCYSFLSILTLRSRNCKSFIILFIITAVLISSSWLVEQRYYLVTLVLFIVLNKDEKRLMPYTIGYQVIFSFIIWKGIVNLDFFL